MRYDNTLASSRGHYNQSVRLLLHVSMQLEQFSPNDRSMQPEIGHAWPKKFIEIEIILWGYRQTRPIPWIKRKIGREKIKENEKKGEERSSHSWKGQYKPIFFFSSLLLTYFFVPTNAPLSLNREVQNWINSSLNLAFSVGCE